jgi:hypothetical protein
MNRRELLKLITLATGGTMIGAEFFMAGCKNPKVGVGEVFTKDDIAFLDEVADTIFPPTESPGAKEAEVGAFMTVMVNDCYTQEDQNVFKQGMGLLDEACEKMHGHGFMKASPAERKSLLESLDKEARAFQKEKSEKEKIEQGKNKDFKKLPNHYFTMMKQMTIFGYFTSKVGRQKGLQYEPVPGKYIGTTDYKKGDKVIVGLH